MSRTALSVIATSVLLACTATVASASPGGVAYIKDKQVWVTKLDGSKKVQLSSGDAWWNAVGQSASGGIVATKNEPGKIAQLSQFAVWNPDGTIKDQGPASPGLNFSGSLAAPLGLELTADNRGIIYGYSHYVYGYPVGTLTQGYALLPTDTRVTPSSTFTNNDARWPTLAGGRVVGTDGTSNVLAESAVGNLTGPFSNWLTINVAGAEIHRAQASADGTIVAVEVADGGSAHPTRAFITKTAGFLGAYVDDCELPSVGSITSVDVSADGALIAYTDDGGLKIVGTPNLRPSGPASCDLPGSPVTIEAGATEPALGPIDVDTLYAARNPAPPPTPGTPPTPTNGLPVPAPGKPPVVQTPTSLKASTLVGAKGTSLTIAVGKAGAVKVTVTVSAKSVGRKGKAIVISTGNAKPSKAGQLVVKLKPTKLGKKLKKKLRGKKVTIVVTSGGKSTRTRVKLR